MATVVSHAMRRFPTTPPDTSYSYAVRPEGSHKAWPPDKGESALSRSMRYADPWLYGSVRAPGGLVLAPALVLCACSDYTNGTKRSSKKGPTTCKKCKGARLPLDAPRFGTVRCYPTAPAVTSSTPPRAGTMRAVSSSSRPSILPTTDPYDLVRRSRLSISGSSDTRARSVSPHASRLSSSRRSILECDINPYELMTAAEPRDASITLVNGQRIRVRPPDAGSEYEDVPVNRPSPAATTATGTLSKSSAGSRKLQRSQTPTRTSASHSVVLNHSSSSISSSSSNNNVNDNHNEKESECNRFKSILKKRTTFGDTDSIKSPKHSPLPTRKSGSHFYLPMPGGGSAPRKKVQFLVSENNEVDRESEGEGGDAYHDAQSEVPPPPQAHLQMEVEQDNGNDTKTPEKVCKLRRSESERLKHESSKVVFLDTMALRNRPSRTDSRTTFAGKDLEKLDGLTRTRRISPVKIRPNEPPPPPPPSSIPVKTKTVKNQSRKDIDNNATTTKNRETSKVQKSETESPVIKESVVITTPIEEAPPAAPPRKRSNNKTPQVVTVPTPQSPPPTPIVTTPNRTVVQINGSSPVHKLQIKNELFVDNNNVNIRTVSVLDSPQRKTSIMITGDDCYSTVNVNDDVPLYQSSVVVKDSAATDAITLRSPKKSSSVYITGNFVSITESDVAEEKTELTPGENLGNNDNWSKSRRNLYDNRSIPSSDALKELLKDPVEAVRRNLVPHVCGKSDVPRRLNLEARHHIPATEESPLTPKTITLQDCTSNSLEDSFLRLRNYETILGDDLSSEHSSSTQYEFVDASSECYTDHSNRSSVTEEELANRTKFYELLADSSIIELADNEDHHYESIKVNPDPIYEEIEIPPPLPSNPPPSNLLDDLHLDKEYTTRSIFEGASKYDILSYLVDAKERGIEEDNYTYNYVNPTIPSDEDTKDYHHRVVSLSTVSDSSEDNSLIISNTNDDKSSFQKTAEVERNDSGVGSETSKSSLSKYRTKDNVLNNSITCEDCESIIDSSIEPEPLTCRKCVKRRSERKEIITEIVETEEKYSRDLQIILEEFYQPMLVAGLLTPDQLSAIFLNCEELLENSQSLAERLRDAVEIALDQADEDLLTVNIGKLFLEAAPMLHAFETYCVRQGSASLLLASLEKEKELLRIFLRVSQMENTMLRRMNLNSFLMVPVQRVTKYPLLLARLYKVTPVHYETKTQLKEAQHKIELHLNHMNQETKDVPSKLWRRIGSSSGRRSSAEMDLVNIKLRKIAVDVLEWNHDEAKFALEGKLLFTQPTDNNWRKGRTIKLAPINALLVINGKPSQARSERSSADESSLVFPRHTAVREAALLLVRDKNGRYSLLREPLYLDRCVIAADPAWQSYFEVQELLGKDTFIFKAEDEEQTKTWYTQLQYHAQGMGAWRKRRNALANIMINGMGLRS